MSFLDEDFHSLPRDTNRGEDYDAGYGCCLRLLTLVQSLSNLIQAKTAINRNADKGVFMLKNE
jgi:hypothetical protein